MTFPGAYTLLLSFILGLGGLFAMIYGAAIAGSEWTWGTLKSGRRAGREPEPLPAAVLRRDRRRWSASGCWSRSRSGSSSPSSRPGSPASRRPASATPPRSARSRSSSPAAGSPSSRQGALGFAIATLARSQLAGIGVGIAVYFGEQFAAIFLPDIVKYLPFNAANAVVATSGGFCGGGGGGGAVLARLDPNTALLVVAAWLIGALLVTALFTERAEISG